MADQLKLPRWTVEQRTALHPLYTRFNFAGPANKVGTIARIFNDVFRNQLLPHFPQGRDAERLRDDYRGRKYPSRSSMYRDITASTLSDEQQQREVDVMRKIKAGIQALRLGADVTEITTGDGEDGEEGDDERETTTTTAANTAPVLPMNATSEVSTEPGASPTQVMNDEQMANVLAGLGTYRPRAANSIPFANSTGGTRVPEGQTMLPPARPNTRHPQHPSSMEQGSSMSNTGMSNTGNTTRTSMPNSPSTHQDISMSNTSNATAISATLPTLTSTTSPPTMNAATTAAAIEQGASVPLPMLHYGDFFWGGPQADAPDAISIDPNSDLHSLGGKVYRAKGPEGSMEDIMICNKDMCDRCKHIDGPPSGDAAQDAARTEGLPFVHYFDCKHPAQFQFWLFQPTGAHRYVAGYPEHMWRTAALFKLGNGEEVLKTVMMCDSGFCDDCLRIRHGQLR